MTVCSVDGCGKIVDARSLCHSHYMRLRRHGDPLGWGNRGMARKFFDDVVRSCTSADCLIWPFTRVDTGYGQIDVEGKMKLVHREACQHRHGPPPSPRHHAAHNCGKGHLGCCNPRHLEWKTPSENEADKIAHGTAQIGENCHRSKLTRDQVATIRSLIGKQTDSSIAVIFGVHTSTVNDIRRGRTWAREAA